MTAMPSREEMTSRLNRAIDAAIGLPAVDINGIRMLIDVGEWLVALETLCTQIYEWEIRLDVKVIQDLDDLNKSLGGSRELTDRLWEDARGG